MFSAVVKDKKPSRQSRLSAVQDCGDRRNVGNHYLFSIVYDKSIIQSRGVYYVFLNSLARSILMDACESQSLRSALSSRLGKSADSADIADAIDAIWKEIDASLFPIVGQRGARALYQRCLFLTVREYPWLTGTFEGVQTIMNLPELRAALLQQTPTNALAAGQAFLQAFETLLATLVGQSLTQRLLSSVCTTISSGEPAQDLAS
jgi:hypothetical protein